MEAHSDGVEDFNWMLNFSFKFLEKNWERDFYGLAVSCYKDNK